MNCHPFVTYRQRHGLSQDDLAKLLGVSGALIGHIETGKRGISAKHVLAWAHKLNLPPEALLPPNVGRYVGPARSEEAA